MPQVRRRPAAAALSQSPCASGLLVGARNRLARLFHTFRRRRREQKSTNSALARSDHEPVRQTFLSASLEQARGRQGDRNVCLTFLIGRRFMDRRTRLCLTRIFHNRNKTRTACRDAVARHSNVEKPLCSDGLDIGHPLVKGIAGSAAFARNKRGIMSSPHAASGALRRGNSRCSLSLSAATNALLARAVR